MRSKLHKDCRRRPQALLYTSFILPNCDVSHSFPVKYITTERHKDHLHQVPPLILGYGTEHGGALAGIMNWSNWIAEDCLLFDEEIRRVRVGKKPPVDRRRRKSSFMVMLRNGSAIKLTMSFLSRRAQQKVRHAWTWSSFLFPCLLRCLRLAITYVAASAPANA